MSIYKDLKVFRADRGAMNFTWEANPLEPDAR
jgi:hypothetical protein